MTDEFTMAEIHITINRLKKNKAAGPDCIKPEHLQNLSEYIVPLFTHILNLIWNGQTLPLHFLQSVVKTLYKCKGAKDDPGNYRGIALINMARKILTSALYYRLAPWAEANGVLPDWQDGFRAHRSTITAIRKLFRHVSNSATPLFALFLDLSKAFDRINRYKLVDTLIEAGVSSKMLQCIVNVIQPNKLIVFDGVNYSDPISQGHGVMQGDPLSALLFAIYMRDLPISQSDREITLGYADDLCVTSNTIEGLQYRTDCIGEWARAKDLQANVDKSVVMPLFDRCHRTPKPVITLNGTELKSPDSVVYLVVSLVPKITNLNLHTKTRIMKLKAAIAALNSKHCLVKMSWSTSHQLWNAALLPIMSYALEITGPHLSEQNWRDMNNVSYTFRRKLLGLPVRYVPLSLIDKMAPEKKICCTLISKPQFQHLQPHHPTHHIATMNNTQQGLHISRLHDARALSPTEFIDVKQLKGSNRSSVANFVINGFHKSFCHDAITCSFNGLECAFCSDTTHELYHLALCKAME